MRRIAFLFPGQGAQEVGIGRDLIGKDPFADTLFQTASAAAFADLARLCVRGPARELDDTKNLQPAMAALELALWHRLVEAGVHPLATAGHSLGELMALAAAGMADPAQVVLLAALRGKVMAEAAANAQGAMIAITGLGVEQIQEELLPFAKRGCLCVASVNAPNQTTISGDAGLVREFAEAVSGRSELKVTALKVSGAWHSAHMQPAVRPFSEALGALTLADEPSVPLIFNRHGREAATAADARELLSGQLVRPVRWDLVMARLAELEISDYVEIGPGKVLRGLGRLNLKNTDVSFHNVSDTRSLERALSCLTR